MSLLRQIQNDAINPNMKVSDLLRKCKILAYRLGNDEFKNWVDSELNGYEAREQVPSYRVLNVTSQGHFSGLFGRELRNAEIPLYCLPSQLQESLSKAIFLNPIATLENLSTKGEAVLSQAWDCAILGKYGSDMYRDMHCIQAWKVISVPSVIGIIDVVKTKILNFVLEIEVINPNAGDVALNSNPIPQEKVSQIFNYYISGNIGNLASGNSHSNIQQTTSSEIPREFLEIISKIQEENSDENCVLQELENKVEELGRHVGTVKYSEKYKELMSFMSDHATVVSGLILPVLPYLSSLLNL